MNLEIQFKRRKDDPNKVIELYDDILWGHGHQQRLSIVQDAGAIPKKTSHSVVTDIANIVLPDAFRDGTRSRLLCRIETI